MIEVADLLITIGKESLNSFWFPIALWTVFAITVSTVLRLNDFIPATYQLHSRSALLAALPFGIIGSALAGLWSALAVPGVSGSVKFIVLQSPIAVTTAAENTASVTWAHPFLWLGIIFILLVTGSLIAVCYLGRNLYKVYKYSSGLRFEPVETVLSNSGISFSKDHHLTVAFSGDVEIPFTYGWRKSRIILPKSLENQQQKLELAIRHELIHIKHYDFRVNNLLTFIRCLFWFHPLVPMLHNSCKEYREIICDSEVLSDSTVSKKSYAKLLFEISTRRVTDNQIVVSMAVNPSTLKKRIQMMNNQANISYKQSILSACISGLLVIGVISCSDLQQNGLTHQEVKQMQTDLAQKPPTPEPVENSPLFVLNGERYEASKAREVVPRIKTKYIKSITVLKDEKAMAKYGEAGVHGVVEITLNAKEKALSDLMEKPPAPPVPGTKSHEGNYFVAVEDMPELIGGLGALAQKINYPEQAHQAGIEGQVIIQFIVNEEGEVENPQVIRGIGGGCDKEALRVVKQAEFTPGLQDGEPVRVQYSMPITFRLS